ncbi:DUF3658 domain-containing protein [Bradyrhizobium lablabi]|uniref:DUF3658 domain-containing protein n=1 Tax=Bradyrhizobium lablabi TaxID=722472 RepID=UPI00090B056E|nr:DUF3658 domain-containing protein [Bradyrhizobium lablabi]SHL27541.1 protein of unknown function [Bradyrhizobium lablabi]
MKTTLHFVFTQSGAGCLVQALRKAGRSDPVIVTHDDLSFGPINSSDRDVRTKWVADELGEPRWINIRTGSERLWDDSNAPDNRKILWLTRRSAMEYAGFLDHLTNLGDAPCDVVDLSEVTMLNQSEQETARPARFAMSLGMLHHDIICREKFWELAEPLQETARKRYQNLWQQLLAENAPLRVIKGDVLVSAPISFFDSRLMSQVTNKWQNVWKVVGQTLVSGPDDLIEYGDTFVMGRLRALVKSGQLEVQGELRDEVRDSRVRLSGAQ